MTDSRDTTRITELARLLERMPILARVVQQRGTGSTSEEAWEIATGLVDIQESAERLFGELMPQLLRSSPNSEEAEDLLHDIGEEYRHILYHIQSTGFFRYVVPAEGES